MFAFKHDAFFTSFAVLYDDVADWQLFYLDIDVFELVHEFVGIEEFDESLLSIVYNDVHMSVNIALILNL